MQTTGHWLQTVTSCSTAPSGGQTVTAPLSNWAYRGRGRVTEPQTLQSCYRSCEALYIAPTFPEAPIQHPHRGNTVLSELDFQGGRKMSYQGKKNIPKITVSKRTYLCFTGCGNFDAWSLQITARVFRCRFTAPRRWIIRIVYIRGQHGFKNFSL